MANPFACPIANVDTPGSGFVVDTLDEVDNAANTFICATSSDAVLSNYILDMWWLAAFLSIGIIAYNLMFGGNVTVREMVGKLVSIVFVLVLVTVWADFAAIFYTASTIWPNEIGNLVMDSTTQINAVDSATYGPGINGALGEFFDAGTRTARRIRSGQGWFKGFWGNVFALFVVIVVFLLTAASLLLLILAKLVVAVVLAVGPIFVIGLLFERTRGFFEGWFRALMSFAFIPIILYSLLALIMTIISDRFAVAATTSVNGFNNGITVIGPIIIIAMVGTALITQVQGIAAQIAGGAALSTQAGVRWAAAAATGGATAAAGAASRKALSGGRNLGGKAFGKLRASLPSRNRSSSSGIKDAAKAPSSSSATTNVVKAPSTPRTGTNPASSNKPIGT